MASSNDAGLFKAEIAGFFGAVERRNTLFKPAGLGIGRTTLPVLSLDLCQQTFNLFSIR